MKQNIFQETLKFKMLKDAGCL